MIIDIIEDIEYRDLMEDQIVEIIQYLLEHNEEFSVTATLAGVEFQPPIPDTIFNKFAKFTMFTLTNYTYSTIELLEDSISFEAGFGEENFSSIVTIPFYAIFQLVINDSILFVNPTATVDAYFIKTIDEGQQRSKKAFLLNPQNKKLL
jgi:hypothetical protein